MPDLVPQRRAPPRRLRAEPPVVAPPLDRNAKPKAPTAASAAELVRAILDDDTLRRGDVAVFPDGAKVFTGRAGAPHRLSDFEDVRTSRLVGRTVRRVLIASTGAFESGPDAATAPTAQRDRAAPAQEPDEADTTGAITRASATR
jgi:hypothetical protein